MNEHESDAERIFLSAREVAVRLDRTPARVYQLISAGVLPATRVAGRVRIPIAAFDEWVEAHTERAREAVR
jgi:excisionase family DNA binding protein